MPEGSGTRVAVSHGYVPLTAAGQEMVSAMTRETFASDIGEWSFSLRIIRETRCIQIADAIVAL